MRSHTRRRWPWFVLLLLAGVVALAWWFPARWAWQWLQKDYPAVHAGAVSGSVWEGAVEDLTVNGQRMGRLRWSLSRLSVFGSPRGRLDLRGAGVMANGHIARDRDGAIMIRDLVFRVPMARLKLLWPAGLELGGTLQGKVAAMRLVDGWPVRLQARVDWRSAQVTSPDGTVALGHLQSRWQAPGGSVVQADLADAGGGPVALDGQLVVTALGWRMHAVARPRHPDPALSRLLERFGQRRADGSVRMQRHGGLAMMEKRS